MDIGGIPRLSDKNGEFYEISITMEKLREARELHVGEHFRVYIQMPEVFSEILVDI